MFKPVVRWSLIALLIAALGGATQILANSDGSESPSDGTESPGYSPPIATPTPTPVPSPLEAVNACVQARMQTGEEFGMSRVPNSNTHMAYFTPKTDAEKSAVQSLREKGYNVGLYLASRRVMFVSEEEMRKREDSSLEYTFTIISSPVSLTDDVSPEHPRGQKPYVPRWQLWAAARGAFAKPGQDRFQADVNGWTVEGRLVRAERKTCLKCHRSDPPIRFNTKIGVKPELPPGGKAKLEVGDPIGVALYVYRRVETQ